MSNVACNLKNLNGRIEKACERAKRDRKSVALIAVSKTFGVDSVREAYDLGVRDFAENRVQELLEKQPLLPADIRWHMIGRFQTNKVKDLIGKTFLIHSLDRRELFEKIDGEARRHKIEKVECLVQVNLSGEATKAGWSAEEAAQFIKNVPADSPVKIRGLMTMGPLTDDREAIRAVFKSAAKLYKSIGELNVLGWSHLSMGMSGDFEIAVEEGATLIRVGTALFGNRA